MRTAKILKYLAYLTLILWIVIFWRRFYSVPAVLCVMIFCGAVLFVILRIIANVSQIAFDIKSELIRALGNIERAVYYSNSLLKEIRDLLDSERDNKKDENSSGKSSLEKR